MKEQEFRITIKMDSEECMSASVEVSANFNSTLAMAAVARNSIDRYVEDMLVPDPVEVPEV